MTVADAKVNTGKFLFEKNANLSTRQINQLYSTLNPVLFESDNMSLRSFRAKWIIANELSTC